MFEWSMLIDDGAPKPHVSQHAAVVSIGITHFSGPAVFIGAVK